MDNSFSENLLMSLVYGIRGSCKKHISCIDFTTVSGFLSIDIDGKTQHRFVISELININSSKEEGHSSCLKTFDWNLLSKKCSSSKNENKISSIVTSARTPHYNNGKDDLKDQPTVQWQQVDKIRHKPMRKSLSSSFNHHKFSASRCKLNNQTFTLENYKSLKSQNGPTCNFSSATVSISKEHSSPYLQQLKKSDDPLNSALQDKIQTSNNLATTNAIPKVTMGRSAPSLNNLKSLSTRTWYGNHEGSRITAHNNPTVNLIKGNVWDKHFRGMTHHEIKHRSIGNFQVMKLGKINGRGSILDKSASYTLKSHAQNIKPVKRSKMSASGCKKTPFQTLHLSYSTSSEDSDISIGSIRPKYLVQHDGDLLLPCPKLVHHSELSATAVNNNRTQSATLSTDSSEESNVIVASSSHISTLINSNLVALNGVNFKNKQEGSKNTNAVNMHEGAYVDNLRNDDTDQTSLASSATLNTISSLETDLPSSQPDHLPKNMRGRVNVKKVKLHSNSKPKISQKACGSSAMDTQRSKVFKWMRLFKQESRYLSSNDHFKRRNDSLTSLKSWSSLKPIISFTTRECKEENTKTKKYHK